MGTAVASSFVEQKQVLTLARAKSIRSVTIEGELIFRQYSDGGCVDGTSERLGTIIRQFDRHSGQNGTRTYAFEHGGLPLGINLHDILLSERFSVIATESNIRNLNCWFEDAGDRRSAKSIRILFPHYFSSPRRSLWSVLMRRH